MTHTTRKTKQNKMGRKKSRTYRLTTGNQQDISSQEDIFITYTRRLQHYSIPGSDSAPTPSPEKQQQIEISQYLYGINTPIADPIQEVTLFLLLPSAQNRRHHDPVQSAWPRSSPKRAVENAAKGEFLQRSRPLDTVNLPLEDDAEQLTPDVPPNQATPPPALCRRTCRQTPCPRRRQRSSSIQ